MDSSGFSSPEFPAYTASPTDNVTTFNGLRPLTKQEKKEKREKLESSEDEGQVPNVELYSGEEEEEGVSPKSSDSARSLVSR